MIKSRLLIALMITTISISMIGCTQEKTSTNTSNNKINTSTSTTKEPTKNASEKVDNADKTDVNEIAANKNMTVEEKYQAAIDSIDLDEYLEQEYDTIEPITPLEAMDKLKSGETFILLHYRSDCRYCKYIHPLTAENVPDGIKVYSVNTDFFRYMYPDDEESDLFAETLNHHNEYKELFNFTGVPNLKYVSNGKVKSSMGNPLAGEYFEENTSKEDKEKYLETARISIQYFMKQVVKDMNNETTIKDEVTNEDTKEPSVSINK